MGWSLSSPTLVSSVVIQTQDAAATRSGMPADQAHSDNRG